jgi:cation transport ATPase
MPKKRVTNQDIFNKLKIVEQESNLSNTDNVILTFVFFLITMFYSLFLFLLTGGTLLKSAKLSPVLITYFFLIPIVIIILFNFALTFFASAFTKRYRFTIKLLSFLSLSGGIFYVIITIIFFILAFIFGVTNKNFYLFLAVLSLVLSLLATFFFTFSKTIKFFKEKYPDLYRKEPINLTSTGKFLAKICRCQV